MWEVCRNGIVHVSPASGGRVKSLWLQSRRVEICLCTQTTHLLKVIFRCCCSGDLQIGQSSSCKWAMFVSSQSEGFGREALLEHLFVQMPWRVNFYLAIWRTWFILVPEKTRLNIVIFNKATSNCCAMKREALELSITIQRDCNLVETSQLLNLPTVGNNSTCWLSSHSGHLLR